MRLSPRSLLTGCAMALSLTGGVAHGWTLGPGADPPDTRDFTVDTSSRNDVLSFWQAIYLQSEGYQDRINWTGNYTSTADGAEGTISPDFVGDVERRVNFVRALCGVPSDTHFNTGAYVNIDPADLIVPPTNTTKAAAAQRSALMLVRNFNTTTGVDLALSHFPVSTCIAWTPAAWNGNNNGNLSVGSYGPTAVDHYFQEDANNLDTGHRRWLLALKCTDYATGDTPGTSVLPPTNTLYVIPNASEFDPSVEARFVTYPGSGYFPAALNTGYWSLSYPEADFSAATISMTAEDGTLLATSVVSRTKGYGDNAIVWQVPAAAAITQTAGDAKFNVTVSNIAGTGVPAQYSYSVTLMNQDRLIDPLLLTGSVTPDPTGASYTFAAVPYADSTEVGFFQASSAAWTEAAEDSPAPQVISHISPEYPLRSAVTQYAPGYPTNFFNGAKAFRLTFGTLPATDQSFEVDRDLLPGTSPKLNFNYRRGYMVNGTTLAVEVTADGGGTWSNLTTILAPSNPNSPDTAFLSASLPLPTTSSQPLRVRFRLYQTGSLTPYTYSYSPTYATGVFIDDISTTGCRFLDRKGSVALAAGETTATFNSANAGVTLAAGQAWWLRLRASLGGHWFPYGPPLTATVAGNVVTGPPDPTGPLTADEYAFAQLDTNQDGVLSAAEYLAIYTKVPKADATFAKIDVDHSGGLTLAEWISGKTNSATSKLIAAYTQRSTAFRELDVDESMTLTKAEFSKMFAPGTKQATIDTAYGKIGSGATLSFSQYTRATTFPSLTTYATAKTTRAARAACFDKLDTDKDTLVSRAEFAHLYKTGTKAATIDTAWAAANGTPKGAAAPATMTKDAFVESVKLPALTVY